MRCRLGAEHLRNLYLVPIIGAVCLISLVPTYLATGEDSPGGARAKSAPTAGRAVHAAGSTIPEVGVRLDAPPPGAVPTVNASDAITKVVAANPTSQIPVGVVPRASLALFSDAQVGRSDDNGQVTPTYQNVLAWIVTVPGTHPIVVGPGALSPELRSELQARTCNLDYALDATTGELLESFQVC